MDGISPLQFQQARPVIGGLLVWLAILSSPQAQEQMPVTVVVARQGAVSERISVVGSLAAREEIQVHPFISGQAIEAILVETGQHVEKGQPLAVLDTTDARMLLDKNAASMLRANAAILVETSKIAVAGVSEAETRRVLERSLTLQSKGALSQQLLDEHQNAHARALAEVDLARQSLALAEADVQIVARERQAIELAIERSTVRAPAAGLVLRRSARIGAITLASAAPLFVVAKDAAIEFVAQVTETSFLQLREGMRTDLVLPGHKAPVAGRLRLNAAELDPLTRSGEVRIELDVSERLLPGAFARGSINASARRSILVPGSTVKTSDGSNSVFVVKEGAVDVRPVSIGTRQDGLVEIVDGLTDGDLVVLKSGGFLKAEDKVRVVMATTDRPSADDLAAISSATPKAGAVR